MRAGGLLIWMLVIQAPVASQSLFESSRSETQELLVSSNLHLGGFIRFGTWLSTDPLTDDPGLQSAYAQTGLLLDAKAGNRASAKADLRFRFGREFGSAVVLTDLREAYIQYRPGPFTITGGKFIKPWGKGTVYQPVEVVTPRDPTVRSPEEDDMNLGYWGMHAGLNIGRHMRINALWKPLYQGSTLLIGPVPMPEYVEFTEPAMPGTALKEGSYGLNIDLFSGPADVSLYWFEGYHVWPGIRLVSFLLDSVSMDPLSLRLQEKAYRIRMAGIDFAIPMGSWIIRGEGAWKQPVLSRSEGEYIPFPEWTYVAEAEWSRGLWTLVAGYHGKAVLDFTPPVADPGLSAALDPPEGMTGDLTLVPPSLIGDQIRQRIGSFNRLYNYQLEEYYHSLYLVTSATLLHDQLELSVPVIHHLVTEEWIVQPSVTYRPADGLEISAGYSGLFGPGGSLNDLAGPTLNAFFIAMTLTY